MSKPPHATWEDLVGYFGSIRKDIAQTSPNSWDAMTYPGLAATPEQLAAAEQRLGRPLDAQHTELLSVINGWPEMAGSEHLLATDQLGAGELWERATESLMYVYEEGGGLSGIPRGELLPFTVSEDTATTYVLWMGGPLTDGGHPVIWVHHEEVERYDNVRAWFLATTKYTQWRLEKLRAQHRA